MNIIINVTYLILQAGCSSCRPTISVKALKATLHGVTTEWWSAGVVICLERGADLHIWPS